MDKKIKFLTELTFMRGEKPGVMYDVIGDDVPRWEDADEVIITIPPNLQYNVPDLLNNIISIQKDTTIFVPCKPITCEIKEKEGKRLFKCDL